MLGISPFTYGLVIEKIYDDGTVLDPAILDITDEQLREAFMKVSFSFFVAFPGQFMLYLLLAVVEILTVFLFVLGRCKGGFLVTQHELPNSCICTSLHY